MVEAIRRNKDSVAVFLLSFLSIIFFSLYMRSRLAGPIVKKEVEPEKSALISKKPISEGAEQVPTLSVPPALSSNVESKKEATLEKSTGRVSVSRGQTKPLFFDYTVKKNDSIWTIAQKYKLPTESIIGCNPGKNLKYLRPGMRLRIPRVAGTIHIVSRGENLRQIARLYVTSVDKIKRYNHLRQSIIHPGQKLFIPDALPIYKKEIRPFIKPINTWITSPFGARYSAIFKRKEFHPGVDFAGRVGDRIRAAKGGVVYSVGFIKGYGLMVIIKHKNGYSTRYAHLNKAYVSPNQRVYQGQYIGEVGKTGLTTGAHLHFEIRRKGYVLNPAKFLALGQ